MSAALHRVLSAATLLLAIVFIAGCAINTRASGQNGPEHRSWLGRLALTVHTQPPQSFAADFDLQGDSHTGVLTFFTPLGTTAARLQWSPESALLHTGGATREFGSLDALTLEATGAVLPVSALLAWLDGVPAAAPGWRVDLQGLPTGRLSAERFTPEPQVQLKVVLER